MRFDWAKFLAPLDELKPAANDPVGAKADLEEARQLLDALVAAAPMHGPYEAEQKRVGKLLETP